MKASLVIVCLALVAIFSLSSVIDAQITTNRQCRNGVSDCYDPKYLCYEAFCVFNEDDGDLNKRHCEYVPIDCVDNNPCTVNDRCESLTGFCIADPNPECEETNCAQCCASNPETYAEQIVVANRGDGTLSSIFADTELLKDTHVLQGSINEPAYLSIENGQVLMVGDRFSSSVRYLDARTYKQYDEIPTCTGVDHMNSNVAQNQLWVACDVDRGFSVLSVSPPALVEHLVSIPLDLIANFTSHDVVVGMGFAIASLSASDGVSADGWLVRYSTSTFTETARLQVSDDANLYYNVTGGGPLYVSDEGGFVMIVDTTSLAVIDQVAIPGVHDLVEHGGVLYVTDSSAETGANSLYAFDVSAGTLVPLAGSPYTMLYRNPHNIVTTSARDKLFVVHTRDSKIAACDLGVDGAVIVPCREVAMSGGFYATQPAQAPNEVPYSDDFVIMGFAAPFGIARNEPACTCDLACWDDNACTVDACHYVFTNSNFTGVVEQCYNYEIPGCTEDPYHVFCPGHQVNLTVADNAFFEITPSWNASMLEFCYTSTFVGNATALVLGFDEYTNCALNLRGTCDNRAAIHDMIPSYCAYDAASTMTTACYDNADPIRAADIPGIAPVLNWANTMVHSPTFMYDPVLGTGHVQGELQDPSGDFVLHIDLVLSGASVAPASPYTPMPLPCYSGPTSPVDWVYFPTSSGRVYAKPGTPYTGLYIDITGTDTYTQFGNAASGRNVNLGLHGAYTWSVLSQPLNSTLTVLAAPPGPIRLFVDLDMDCLTPLDYCALFEEPQPAPANGWSASLVAGDLRYCRNFTVGQLAGCRAYGDTHTALLDYALVNTTNLYNGRFYATLLRPENCHSHVTAYYGECGEQVLCSFAFDFSLSIDAGGVVSASYTAADLGFDAVWIENVWLPSGDMKIVFETRVRHVERDPITMPETTLLVDAAVVLEDETGYPMTFESAAAACEEGRDPEFCFQRWCLVSENAAANNVTDFGGLKPTTFDVRIKGHVLARVMVNFNITAARVGDNQHVHGAVDAALELFQDAQFAVPYNGLTGSWLLDCAWLYGELTLGHYAGSLAAHIVSAYVCWSPTGDMLPYDPNNPSSTGCNSRPDAVHYLVYSDDPFTNLTDPAMHNFAIIPTPLDPSIARFAFMVHALTPHKQVVQIQWQAYDLGGALVSSLEDISLNVEGGSDGPTEGTHGDHYMVKCAGGFYYDLVSHACVPISVGNESGPNVIVIVNNIHDNNNNDDDGGFGIAEIVLLSLLVLASFAILGFLCFGEDRRRRHHHRHRRPKEPIVVSYTQQNFTLRLPNENYE